MQELICAIAQKHTNRPILVIGGGPSVLTDLTRDDLPDFSCVISANGHGTRQRRYPVDYLVNVDKHHCETHEHMSKVLGRLGIPIINRYSWADYRLPDWDFPCNSGVTAIAVACALGGNPICVTGLDFWGSGRNYFHDPAVVAKVLKHGTCLTPTETLRHRRATGRVIALDRLMYLKKFAGGSNIRAISGPLVQNWPLFNLDETYTQTADCAYRAKILTMQTVYVKAMRSFNFDHRDVTPAGTILALSPGEAKRHIEAGSICKTQLTRP